MLTLHFWHEERGRSNRSGGGEGRWVQLGHVELRVFGDMNRGVGEAVVVLQTWHWWRAWEGGIRTCKGAWRGSAVVRSEEQWSEARTPRQPTVEWPNRWGSPLETRDVRRSQESVESWKSQEACSRRGSSSSVWFCCQCLRSTFGVAQQELSQLRGDEAGSRLKNWGGGSCLGICLHLRSWDQAPHWAPCFSLCLTPCSYHPLPQLSLK